MANTYLDSNGVSHFWEKIKSKFVPKETGKGLSTNDYTTVEKNKLAGIDTGAQKNQAAYARIQLGPGMGSTVLEATVPGATLMLHGIPNNAVQVYPIGDNEVVISADNATSTSHGAMSAADKIKLDAFQEASKYALKTDITGVYKYKGTVGTSSDLPSSGQEKGDVYNIEAASTYGAAGTNVAWDGEKWDSLGGMFSVEAMTNADIDSICV